MSSVAVICMGEKLAYTNSRLPIEAMQTITFWFSDLMIKLLIVSKPEFSCNT